jgi:FKBP-type peptidyl-prolyl cis-trans isomerase
MSKTKRTAIFLIALLFLITSVGFSLLVFVDLTGNDSNQSEVTRSLDDIVADSQQAELNDQLEQQEVQQNEGDEMLQGTKLEGFEPRDNVSELEITDLKEGSGEVVKEGATVTAHYTGALVSNGTIFQSSYDGGSPIPFSLNGVIQGWTEGVPGMKVGGVRRLVIPAEKAYGANSPSPDIPANADLVFDITLVSVEQ